MNMKDVSEINSEVNLGMNMECSHDITMKGFKYKLNLTKRLYICLEDLNVKGMMQNHNFAFPLWMFFEMSLFVC